MGLTCSDIAAALIPAPWGDAVAHYFTDKARISLLNTDLRFREEWVGTMLNVGDDPVFHLNGEVLGNFSLILNTVLSIGNDPLCLFARLHGQCEIHAYVEGPERAWVAGVIKQGLETGLYRQGVGWDSVVTLLEQSNTEPVVTSYSVCEGFPNYGIADWTPPSDGEDEDSWEAWYELPDDERWDLALAGLRSRTDIQPLSSENLRGRFGHGKTLFDVLNQPRPAELNV